MKQKNTILLVDDDEVFNFIAKETIEIVTKDTTEIIITKNGQQAVDYMLTNKCPDLIFLDLNMPIMDGFQFLDQLEENQICQQSRVAILSTSNREKDREKASGYTQVFDYIEKPLSIEKLEQLLSA